MKNTTDTKFIRRVIDFIDGPSMMMGLGDWWLPNARDVILHAADGYSVVLTFGVRHILLHVTKEYKK